MKKILCLSFYLSIALNTMAFSIANFRDDVYSAMDRLRIFLIVWGCFQIIVACFQIRLFFKVWGMTNNIKALKKDYFFETEIECKDEMIKYLKKNLILGNIEGVKRALLRNFMNNVERGYNQLVSHYNEDPYNTKETEAERYEKKIETSIEPYIEHLKSQFKKIGEEVPNCIIQMKTFRDYLYVFKEDELDCIVNMNPPVNISSQSSDDTRD